MTSCVIHQHDLFVPVGSADPLETCQELCGVRSTTNSTVASLDGLYRCLQMPAYECEHSTISLLATLPRCDTYDLPSDPSEQVPDAGSRFAHRRRFPRFTLDAHAETIEPIEKLRFLGRAIEISEGRCFIALSDAPPVNQIVQLRIEKGVETFGTWAKVIYNRPGSGIGLRFIATAHDEMTVLKTWLGRLERI